jgi:hypothetical protein
MIEPSHDEIDFIRRFGERGGSITLHGELRLLKIGRLVPQYVTHTKATSQMGHFTLTAKGWELAQLIDRKPKDTSKRSGQL